MDGDFGTVLRRLRKRAGLTQEALAQRSGLSVEGISALERGQRRHPRADTVDLLATGLGLGADERRTLVGAAARALPGRAAQPSRLPHQLPARSNAFTGREAELRTVTGLLASRGHRESPVVVAIVGMGGLGKTTLAVHAASSVVDDYPDGQLYLDLRGHDTRAPLSPLRALTFLIGALGGEAGEVPDDVDQAAAIFRSLVSDSRILFVLDNAADAVQVQPLLPAAPGCGVLVTSRRALAGHVDAHHVPLEVLRIDESRCLLGRLVGEERLERDPGAASELARTCGGLPLAIRIVAARLTTRPSWPLAFLASRLTEARTCLSELCAGDLAVRSNIALSVENLEASDDPVDVAAARVHLWCGLLPSTGLSVPAVAGLTGLSEEATATALERLADVSLVEVSGPGRYRAHDLVHAVAREQAERLLDLADRAAALDRLMGFYVAVAWRTRHQCRATPEGVDAGALVAASGSLTDPATCLDLLVTEADQFTGLAASLAASPSPSRDRLPWLALGLITYFVTRVDTAGWPEMLALAVETLDEAAPVDGRPAALVRGHLLEDLALALSGRGEHDSALEQARLAVEAFRAAGAARAEAAALGTEGIVLGRLDRPTEAVTLLGQALAISERLGDVRSTAAAHRDLGLLLARTGEPAAAITHERCSLELYGQVGVTRGVAMAAVNLGVMLRDTGELAEARTHLERSVAIFHDIGDRAGLTEALEELGYWHVVAGDADLGLRILSDGLALVDEADSGQWEASLRKRLGLVLLRLGRRAEAEQHWRAALRIHMRRGEWRAVAEAHELLGTPVTSAVS